MQTRFLSVLSVGVLAACSPAPHPAARPAPKKNESAATPAAKQAALVRLGGREYKRYCALCHGKAGVGHAADHAIQLRNPTFLATAGPEYLWDAIAQGRPGTPMAAFSNKFGGPLDEHGIRALVKYVESLGPMPSESGFDKLEKEVVKGDPARGAPLYAQHCASCHGAHGEGNNAPSLSNPNFLATASDGFIRYAVEHGRPSTRMRAFHGKLTEQQIGDITHYIRTWARNTNNTPVTGEPLPPMSALVLHPHGPPPKLGPLEAGRYISAKTLRAVLARKPRLVLLDARPTSDWYKAHIPGAFPAPFYEKLDKLTKALPRDGTWIVAYCACPHTASDHLVDKLRARGFTHTAVLKDGFLVWAQRGYPAVFGRHQ